MNASLLSRHRWLAMSLVPVLVLCLLSYLWLDQPVALWFKAHLGIAGTQIFTFITRFGEAQYSLVPAALIWAGCRWAKPDSPATRVRLRAISDGAGFVFLSVAATGILVDLLKIMIGRYRPNELFLHGLYGFAPFHAGWSVASFPSGHSQTAFAAMVPLVWLLPRQRALWLAIALLIVASRIVLSAHYVADTMMGAWIGTAGAILIGDALADRRAKAQLI